MNVFTLSFDASAPLYTQLYRRLVAAITTGELAPGERLPSKRGLAGHLGVSVNTVDGAYQMLLDEGYVLSRPRKGFFVADLPRSLLPRERPSPPRPVTPPPASSPAPAVCHDLGTSLVDPDVFPFATWARLTRSVLMRGRRLLVRGEVQGEAALRSALAGHLRAFRGVSVTPDRIIIGAGMEYLLGILARLTGREAVYGLEDPGYVKVRHILENNGVRHTPIPMDAEGMRPECLRQAGADIAHVTPAHQYPMGTTMPVGRRLALIAWAGEVPGRYIIEDDYDSEFRYAGRPVPSMSGLTPSERVIYIGTLSRSIAPSIRLAYMVLPEPLLTVYRRRFGMYACTVSVFEQQTLAAFIAGGHFARHLNRMRTLCRKRRDALIGALNAAFGSRVRISGAGVGLHLLVTLSGGPDEAAMVESAARHGIRLHGLSEFAASPSTRIPAHTVLMGYAALRAEQIPDVIHRLQAAWTRPATVPRGV